VASTTDFLALWGAVVATIVATWNIYRDFIKRDRILVEAGFHIWSVTQNKVFFLKVLNSTSRVISVTHCIGYDKKVKRRRWMQRLLRPTRQGTCSPPRRSTGYVCRRRLSPGITRCFSIRSTHRFPRATWASSLPITGSGFALGATSE
jgi:hypothetical protein